MILRIMLPNGVVNEFEVERVFTIKKSVGEYYLYYETTYDSIGKGHEVPLTEIVWWEAKAINR